MEQTKPKRDYYGELTQDLIEALRKGVAPWQKPWNENYMEDDGMRPRNAKSGDYYGWKNTFLLAVKAGLKGYKDPRWLTYKQAKEMGAQVKKGEKGAPIVFVTDGYMRKAKDENGKPILDDDGNQKTEYIRYKHPVMTFYCVFNAEQVDGLPKYQMPEPPKQEWEASERADKILQNSEATIKYVNADKACYSLTDDCIILPPKTAFNTQDGFYSTALHELGHWTGSEERLNRPFGGRFGSPDYAREELRAEIASYFVCSTLRIENATVDNHAAYVDNWVQALENDKHELFNSIRDAEKISNFVLALEQKKIQEVLQDLKKGKFEEVTVEAGEAEEVTENRAPVTIDKPVYVDVPYPKRFDAKALGAKWDTKEKSWYVPAGVNLVPFEKYGLDITKFENKAQEVTEEVTQSEPVPTQEPEAEEQTQVKAQEPEAEKEQQEEQEEHRSFHR